MDEVTRLAKAFFGFGENPGLIKLIFPFIPRTRPNSLVCINYPKYQHDVSPDDLLSGIRLYSLLLRSYPNVEVEFAKGLSYVPTDYHRVLIGGPPTNQFIAVSTKDCPIYFDEDPEKRVFHYPQKGKRYEIKTATIGSGTVILEDYCLLLKRTINKKVEFVVGGLRAYGQEGAYYFLNEPAFYNKVRAISSAENFEVLVRVLIKDTSVVGWEIVEALELPPVDPSLPEYDAFLCHSSNDRERVFELAEQLKSQGLTVWLDAEQIRVGDSIVEEIQYGLENSRYVIVCISAGMKGSNYSRAEYGPMLHQEFTDRVIRVIPVEIGPCVENDVPLLLRGKLRVRVDSTEGFNKLIDKLKG